MLSINMLSINSSSIVYIEKLTIYLYSGNFYRALSSETSEGFREWLIR
jgi:hypothetical protein